MESAFNWMSSFYQHSLYHKLFTHRKIKVLEYKSHFIEAWNTYVLLYSIMITFLPRYFDLLFKIVSLLNSSVFKIISLHWVCCWPFGLHPISLHNNHTRKSRRRAFLNLLWYKSFIDLAGWHLTMTYTRVLLKFGDASSNHDFVSLELDLCPHQRIRFLRHKKYLKVPRISFMKLFIRKPILILC